MLGKTLMKNKASYFNRRDLEHHIWQEHKATIRNRERGRERVVNERVGGKGGDRGGLRDREQRHIHICFIKKLSFFLSLNFLNFTPN